jgi:hypothetical protein
VNEYGEVDKENTHGYCATWFCLKRYSVIVCLKEVLKMAAFDLDSQSGPI